MTNQDLQMIGEKNMEIKNSKTKIIKYIVIFILIFLIILRGLYYFMHKKNTRAFVLVNGKKQYISKEMDSKIKDQIKNTYNYNTNNTVNSSSKEQISDRNNTQDTINNVQKINKFNEK
jgi:hypothetical protein